MLHVRGFLTPYMKSFCYIVSEAGHSVMVDPCKTEEIREYISAKRLQFDYCFLTHEHFDHISGLDWVHSMDIPVVASEKCGEALKDSRKNQSRYFGPFSMLQSRLKGFPIPHVDEYAGYADILFSMEKKIEWEGHGILLKETPGHSEGSICILIDGRHLFCGDTIFRDYDTNTKIPGGDREALMEVTMPWLVSLDKNIDVYPGHYECFRLKEWRDRNDTVGI